MVFEYDDFRKKFTKKAEEVDEEIVSKLTGKAANYFAGIIAAVNG